jgi:hypothetical protein
MRTRLRSLLRPLVENVQTKPGVTPAAGSGARVKALAPPTVAVSSPPGPSKEPEPDKRGEMEIGAVDLVATKRVHSRPVDEDPGERPSDVWKPDGFVNPPPTDLGVLPSEPLRWGPRRRGRWRVGR